MPLIKKRHTFNNCFPFKSVYNENDELGYITRDFRQIQIIITVINNMIADKVLHRESDRV